MESPLRKKINSIMKDHRKRQVWYRIVTSLAVVVVFITTYMLILPAITMENKAQCGITEHQHDANCYSTHYEKEKVLACTTESLGVHKHTDACYDAEHKLICGYADFVIHQHDASCYDAEGTLVCTIPEHKLHEHTESCYQMQKQLVCTQEEYVGHTHTAECYTKEQGALICAQEEHTHGEGCYDEEGNLVCEKEEHVHGDECYQWNDVLTCTIPESAGHQHGDACYQDVKVLVCEEPAELHTHTDACYKDGVLACGKVELKEHKHDDSCYREEQVLVEELVCDRVEHVHTDECYKGSKSGEASEASSDENDESIEAETSSESAEKISSEEASSEEVSSEEISSEEASSEEVSTEAISTEEGSTEEITSEEASDEETSTEELSSEEASTEEITSEAETEEESSEEEPSEAELPGLTGNWSVDMMLTAQSLIGYEKSDFVKFCFDHVGISAMNYNSDLEAWIADLIEQGLYASGEDFDPTPGDVIFFDKDEDGKADHTGIVTDVLVDDEYNIMQIMVAESGKENVVEENVYLPEDERIKGHCRYLYEEYHDDIDTLESFIDFWKYVTSLTGTGTVYDPVSGSYTSNLQTDFEIAKKDITSNGYSYELKYPEGIIVPDSLLNGEYDLPDEKKITAGKFFFVKNTDGTYSIRIKFDEQYVKNAGDTITGHVWFKGKLSDAKADDKGDIIIAGSDKVSLVIPKKEITYPSDETNNYNLKITKTGSYNRETGKLEYTVVVYSTKGTPGVIDFSDIIRVTGMKLQAPDVTVTKSEVLDNKNGWVTETDKGTVSGVTPSYDAATGTLTMKLPKMEIIPPDKDGRIGYVKYYIKYTYDVSEMEIGTLTADNTAKVESKDKDTKIVKEDDNKISIKNEYSISKTHTNELENGRIKWTITLNENQIDIANSTLTDDMLAKLKDGTDVEISPDTGVEVVKNDGKITSIKFKPVVDGKNTNKYTITYYTAVESSWKPVEISNTANFKPSKGETIGTTDKTTVGGGDVDKTMDGAEISADGKTTNVNWTVSVVVPDGSLPRGTMITDTTMNAWESLKHYLTPEQIRNWGGTFHWENESGSSLETGNFTDSSKFEMKFLGSDGKEYSYSEAIAVTENTVTFNKITVKLLDELKCSGASKLKFSYSTTADLSNASFGDNAYYNTVKVDDKEKKVAYHYSKAGIIKSDGEGQTTQTSVTNDGELTWKIKVMTDDKDYQTLTVTDEFPSGVRLTGLSIQLQGGSWAEATFTINQDGTLQASGRFCDEFLTEGSTYKDDKLTLIIKNKNGGKMSSNLTFEVKVTCEVKDAQSITAGTKYIFENKASAKEDNVEIGSSSQTQEWTKKDNTVVTKVVDKSGEWDQKHNKANYSIILNPDAKDLVEGTDVLTLVDIFSCYNKSYDASHLDENGNWTGKLDHTKVTRVYAELDPNSLKLYYAVKNEQGVLQAGTEVTGWSWNYKSSDGGNDWTNHTLTISGVPDEKALIFEYGYIIERDAPDEYNNVQVLLKNEAELSGTSEKDKSDDQTVYWKEASAGGGVTTDKNYTLYKVDKNNYGKTLSGAVFELQEYTNGAYKKVDPAVMFTTDDKGIIRIKWDSNLFKKNILYRLVEVQPPSGYKIPDGGADVIEFYFSDLDSPKDQLPTEIPKGAVDLTKTSQVAYIENEVTQSITLPETGGIGTYWYTLGGLLLIAGAALLMYRNFVRKGGKRI